MDPNRGRFSYRSISVAGAPPVEFCIEPAADDPVGAWLLENDWIDEPVQRAFLDLVEPGMRVLDLGCHIGVFSLPAARLGAAVLAVDASPAHVEWLGEAGRRNGFGALTVVHGAIAGAPGMVEFVVHGIHGHVDFGTSHATTAVPARSVDDLLAEHGWDAPDLIKMDIEGSEQIALDGMERLFASGARPLFVFECNASTLPSFGSSTRQLRKTFAALGYELLLIDHLRTATLVESGPDTAQPETVCDYLAVPKGSPWPSGGWTIEPPMTAGHVLARLIDVASSGAEGYRLHAARMLASGPAWLTTHPAGRQARRALEFDESAIVREALDPRHAAASDESDLPEPPPGRAPDAIVWCEGLAAGPLDTEPDRTPDMLPPVLSGSFVHDVWMHARAGDLVVVVTDDRLAAGHLLDVIADGAVVAGRVIRPLALGALEHGLTVATNIVVLAAQHGAHVPELAPRVEELCEWAELGPLLDTQLAYAPEGTAERIGLVAGLCGAVPAVVLLDHIEPRMRERVGERVAALRAAGTAVVQVTGDAGEALGNPTRALWIDAGEVEAYGRPVSVLAAAARVSDLLGAPA